MSNSSILGGERAPSRAAGRDTDALGPSDSSDSGSDVQGERVAATPSDDGDFMHAVPATTSSDTDGAGTGERGAAVPDGVEAGADIAPDRVDSPDGSLIDDELIAELASDESPEPEDDDAPTP